MPDTPINVDYPTAEDLRLRIALWARRLEAQPGEEEAWITGICHDPTGKRAPTIAEEEGSVHINRGHYEVNEGPYAKDYVWSPAHALIECGCGQVMDADEHHTTCPNSGPDHSALMREVVGRHLSEEVLHPWHRDYEEWLSFKQNRGEYQEWLEDRDLDQNES